LEVCVAPALEHFAPAFGVFAEAIVVVFVKTTQNKRRVVTKDRFLIPKWY
jgi:hypothetical protein